MNNWEWLAFTGSMFEIAGLFIAIRGLRALKSDLFPGRPLPGTRARNQFSSWFRRSVLRRRPAPQVVQLGTATATVSVGATAFGQVIPPRPETLEPSEAWVRHIVQRLDNLDELRARDRQDTQERLRGLNDRIAEAMTDLGGRIESTDERLLRSLGGADGRGVDETWWGLSITFVGVVLQGIAIALS